VRDAAFGAGAVDLRAPLVALAPQDAAVAAARPDGGAAVTVRAYDGGGRAVAYGFFPGWVYWLSADHHDPGALPRRWSDAARDLAVAPARLAGAPRAVTVSRPGVEALRLDAPEGIAVVLLNWTGEPIEALDVAVSNPGRFARASSIERGLLRGEARPGALGVTLPLETVDVLMVE
jgi:hypothetical protein